MKRLYEKNEVYFALVWIGLYVVVMNAALQFCDGFDNLASKTAVQVIVPVVCILLLSSAATIWIIRNNLTETYGLCSFKGKKGYLLFLPLILMSCINLKNGLAITAPLAVSLLMMINMAAAGYVEELIFRGFLFRAMQKDNLKSAIIVSAVTFGAGHIVNLANTSDVLSVLMQVCYAIAIGFLYTIIVYKGGSLWPCIVSHMFVNGSSVFALEEGLFSKLLKEMYGYITPELVQINSAVLIILIAGGYTIWLWKKAE